MKRSSNLNADNIIPIDARAKTAFKDIIGQSPSMKRIFKTIEKVARSDTTIMLNGETGTGKGLFARAIHECSSRCENAFIQINCGATPEGLLESEFFGYRRGAFTGAHTDKPGKFELAQGRRVSSSVLGATRPSRRMPVLSQRPTAIWKKKSRKGISGRTCSTGYTSSRFACRPCASGCRTSHFWSIIS
jgi:transcriptional regulator of aromatic amino acid metabolism